MTVIRPMPHWNFFACWRGNFRRTRNALYVSIHAYSDLSTFLSQELARGAPSSIRRASYWLSRSRRRGSGRCGERISRHPAARSKLPGIHFRLGRALLSHPNPGPEVASDAKQEFERELQIDPKNAGAYYVLGELGARTSSGGRSETFSRAAKLDPQFGEASSGWERLWSRKSNTPMRLCRSKLRSGWNPGIRMPITISRWLTLALDVSKMATKEVCHSSALDR